jgi:hypothetical protein
MGDFLKREVVAIVFAVVVICALSALGSIYVIKNHVIGERDDPLARAGGLKSEPVIQPK